MGKYDLKIIKNFVGSWEGLKRLIDERESHLRELNNINQKTDIIRADTKRTSEFLNYLKIIKQEDFKNE